MRKATTDDEATARAARIRKVGAIQQSQADASFAASGVKIGEGSPVDITRTIGQQSELDAVNTMLTGSRLAQNDSDQAGLIRAQGANAESSAYIGAGTTILGAASWVQDVFYGTALVLAVALSTLSRRRAGIATAE